MPRHRSISLIVTALISFFAANAASAHRPITGNPKGINAIPDPITSYAFYESLDTGGDVDIYGVFVEAGQFFHAGINIPQIDGLEDYEVSLALLGPGLPVLSDTALPAFPHDHEENENAHDHFDANSWTDGLDLDGLTGIVVGSEESEDFYEPFTLTRYWGRQVVELDLLEAGTYYLLVWQPDGIAGKYVLDTGRAERFSLGDLFRFPVWWVQIHIYFEHTAGLIAGAAVILIITLGAVARLRFWRSQH
jgi:hypothetical protein